MKNNRGKLLFRIDIFSYLCIVNEREAVSLIEKRRFAGRERPFRSKTDRVMT